MNTKRLIPRLPAVVLGLAVAVGFAVTSRAAMPDYRLEVLLRGPSDLGSSGWVDFDQPTGHILSLTTFGGWNEGYRLFDSHPHAVLGDPVHLATAPKSGMFAVDPRYCYTSEYYGGKVGKYDLNDGHLVKSISVGSWPAYMAFDARRWNLYVGTNGANESSLGTVKVIDTVTDTLRSGGVTLNGALGHSLVVSPDQHWLYCDSLKPGAEQFYKIDISNPNSIHIEDSESIPGVHNPGFSISPDGTRAYVPDVNAGTIRLYDTASMTQVGSWSCPGATGFWIAPDGTQAIFKSFGPTDMKVGVYDVAHQAVSQTFTFFASDIGNFGPPQPMPVCWNWNDGLKGVYVPIGAERGGVAVFVRSVPGDVTGDEYVAFADYQILESHFGATNANWMMGDFNGDGAVTFADYQILEVSFGHGVPEPASLSLLALGGLAFVRRRRWAKQ